MSLRGLLARLFADSAAPPAFSPDLGGDDPGRLRTEMLRCLDSGSPGDAGRRADAMLDLYRRLAPEGRARFTASVRALDGLDGPPGAAGGYARMEELELFGRASHKLSVLDSLEPRRRRLLALFAAAPGGREALEGMRQDADGGLADEIDRALADAR